jgi:hypothetical protein
MIGTLLRQLNVALGKAFLFAGVIPASLVLGLYYWYQYGAAEVSVALGDLFDKENAAFFGVVLIGLSLAFQAARARFTEEMQTFPGQGRIVRSIRRSLVKRQIERRRRAMDELDEGEWLFGVLQWHVEERDGERIVPPFRLPRYAYRTYAYRVSRMSDGDVEDASRAALNALTRLIHSRVGPYDAWPSDATTVVHGLTTLYTALCLPGRAERLERLTAPWIDITARFAMAATILDELAADRRGQFNTAFAATQFPLEADRIQPTALGNQFAVLDEYAKSRYGIATGTLWIRLNSLLSREEQTSVTDAQLRMETMVMVAVALAGFATVTTLMYVSGQRPSVVSTVNGVVVGDWTRLLAFTLPCAAGAVLAYQSAIFASGAFAERVIQLIDTRRLAVIRAAGFEPPKKVAEEIELFRELNEFYVEATARNPDRRIVDGTPVASVPPGAAPGGTTREQAAAPFDDAGGLAE